MRFVNVEKPREERSIGVLARAGVALSLLAVLLLPWAPSLACDGCANKQCTSGLEQGTFGCSEGEVSCSLIGKIVFGCGGHYCSTAGNPVCDNRKSATGSGPTVVSMSAEGTDACTVPQLAREGVLAKRTATGARKIKTIWSLAQPVP